MPRQKTVDIGAPSPKTATKVAAKKAPKPETDPKLKAKAQAEAEKQKAAKAEAGEKAKADKAAEKEKADAAKEKLQASGLKQLNSIAAHIVAGLDAAAKNDQKADDHRLSAAVRLAEAEKVAKETGVKFKEWYDATITNYSFETVRKLLSVGKAEDPKAALEDMRTKNNERNKKMRDGKKRTASQPEGKTGPKQSALQRVEEAVAAMPDSGKVDLAKRIAKDNGMVVISETAAKSLVNSGSDPVGQIKSLFTALPATLKLQVVDHIETLLGYKFISKSDFDAYGKLKDAAAAKK